MAINLAQFKVAPTAGAPVAGAPPVKTGSLDLSQFKVKAPAPSPSPVVDAVKAVGGYVGGIASHAIEGFTKNVADTGAAIQAAGAETAPVKKVLKTGVAVERGILGPLTTATDALFTPVGDAVKAISSKISDIPVVQRLAMSDSVGKVLQAAKDAGQTLDQLKVANPDLAPDVENVANLLMIVAGEKPATAAVKATGEATTKAAQGVIDFTKSTASDLAKTGGERITAAGDAAAKKLAAPFSESFKPDVAAAFSRQGVEAPVSAVSSSKAVQAAEAAAQASIFGGGKVTEIINDARKSIFNITESLRKEVNPEKLVTPGATPEAAGKALQGAVTKVRDTFNAVKTKLYEEANAKIGSQQADLTETRKALEDIIASKANSLDPTARGQARFYQQILNATRTAQKRTFAAIKQTRTDIGSKLGNRTDPITTGDAGNLKRLYGALSTDLDKTVAASGADGSAALTAATEYYKAGIARINSFVGRTIYNAKSPELLIGKLVKPGDISTIKELKGLVGAEAHHTFAAALVNRIVADSMVPLTGKLSATKISTILAKYGDGFLNEAIGPKAVQELKDLRKAAIVEDILDRGTKDGKVMPSALAHAIDSYGDKVLRDAFTPEELAKLKDVQTMADGIAKGTKMAEGSPTAEKLDLLLTGGLFATFNVPLLVAKLGFQFGLTKLVTSRLGKSFLTGGGREIGATAAETAAKASEAVSAAKSPEIGQISAKTWGQDGVYRYSEKGAAPVTRVTVGKKVIQRIIDGETKFVLEERDASGKLISQQTFSTKAEAMGELNSGTVPKGG